MRLSVCIVSGFLLQLISDALKGGDMLIMRLYSHMNVFEWEKSPSNFWHWKGKNLNSDPALTGINLSNSSCFLSALGFNILFDYLQLADAIAPPAIGLKLMKEASLENQGRPWKNTLLLLPASDEWTSPVPISNWPTTVREPLLKNHYS